MTVKPILGPFSGSGSLKTKRGEIGARVAEALVIHFSVVAAAENPDGLRESEPFGLGIPPRLN